MVRKIVIAVSVADLRREPRAIQQEVFLHDDLRETQLLYGEKGNLLDARGEWLKIEALEQFCFNESYGWHPYSGWIHRCEAKEVEHFPSPKKVVCTPFFMFNHTMLSYGTLVGDEVEESFAVRKIPKAPCREMIVEEAKLFLGSPYLWGGRSFPLKKPLSSVDCSGLVNLLYRAQGITLPRNAHEQYLKAKPTPFLKPGDPLYLAKENKINHVLLKVDERTFIESPQTGDYVKLLRWGEQIWEDRGKIRIQGRPSFYTPYPASFI